jgi:thioredoxin 1
VESTPAMQTQSEKAQLLFFHNPNGAPCQMQAQILAQASSKIEAKLAIKYISTDNPADRDYFYQYGIRGLPSLIILNKEGKEIQRFSPGIQTEDTILNFLNSCKC